MQNRVRWITVIIKLSMLILSSISNDRIVSTQLNMLASSTILLIL